MHTAASTCQNSSTVFLSSQVWFLARLKRNRVFCQPSSLPVNCLKQESSSKQALKRERQAHTHSIRQTDCTCLPGKPKLKYQSPQVALLKRKGPYSPRFSRVQRSTGTCARKARIPLHGEPVCCWEVLLWIQFAAWEQEEFDNRRRYQIPPSLLLPWLGPAHTWECCWGCSSAQPLPREIITLLQLLLWSSPSCKPTCSWRRAETTWGLRPPPSLLPWRKAIGHNWLAFYHEVNQRGLLGHMHTASALPFL